jgi:hypothetical protein
LKNFSKKKFPAVEWAQADAEANYNYSKKFLRKFLGIVMSEANHNTMKKN